MALERPTTLQCVTGSNPAGALVAAADAPLFLSRSAMVGVVGGADAAADDQALPVHQVHREQPGWSIYIYNLIYIYIYIYIYILLSIESNLVGPAV